MSWNSPCIPCADQRFFAGGGGGGGGGSRPDGLKTAWTTFPPVLSLFYSLQRGSVGFIAMKIILSQGSRWGQHFPGGGGGGVQMLISIETHITCYFPGGSRPPILLDPHMHSYVEIRNFSRFVRFTFRVK